MSVSNDKVIEARDAHEEAVAVCDAARVIMLDAEWGDPLWAATVVFEASKANVEVKYAEWLRVSNESESV